MKSWNENNKKIIFGFILSSREKRDETLGR